MFNNQHQSSQTSRDGTIQSWRRNIRAVKSQKKEEVELEVEKLENKNKKEGVGVMRNETQRCAEQVGTDNRHDGEKLTRKDKSVGDVGGRSPRVWNGRAGQAAPVHVARRAMTDGDYDERPKEERRMAERNE
uniref:Uncharacterized protein n=1 Tax=Globodera rostochiensis TaxID=31243 RepID=A0A914IHI1_GLORO